MENTKKKYQTLLADRDDFYSTVLDMILYFYKLDPNKHIRNQEELKRWLQYQEKNPNPDLETIFIIDEFFMSNPEDMLQVLTDIKKAIPNAKLISYATSLPDEIAGKEHYQYFSEKTGKSTERTISRVISEITGLSFSENQADPEYL